MKVIDLLNKIANGEEVPKKILIRGYEFHLSNNYQEMNINYAYEDAFNNYWLECKGINEEIGMIEEDKEIEEIPFNNGMKEFIDVYHELEHYNYKINELIKAVNELKKGK